jgi:hypothetical protein
MVCCTTSRGAPNKQPAQHALAALYQPVRTSAIQRPADFCLGLVSFGLLVFWKTPPWLVVLLAAVAGAALARFG